MIHGNDPVPDFESRAAFRFRHNLHFRVKILSPENLHKKSRNSNQGFAQILKKIAKNLEFGKLWI